MAVDRTFTLIGNFTDNISPSLVKVHRSLDNVKRHIASVTKSTSVLKDEFKELALSSKSFNDSLKGQAGDLTSSIGAIKKYRQELNRLRRDQSKIRFPPSPPPGGGGGYGGGGGRNRGRSYGGGYSGGGVARDSSYVFSQVLGNQVAGIMTNAIFSGFQMGVGLMMKPFEYFQSALQERIADQQSDIKAAGGYYSIAKRQADGKKFIKTFDEAMTYTQMNNKYMSELAKALPGNTAQYVEISKRLSDSIARIVVSDPKKAIEYANKLRSDPNRIGGTAAAITDTGAKGMRMAMTDLVGEITKKTVLAGLGGGAQGGVTGATGLPGLAERMLTQDQLSFGQLRRYAAIFRDPMISDALERYIPKINATTGSTVERFEIVNKMFDEILPPEVIRAFMRSTAGVLEAFRSTFLDPEIGLFGLGRKFKDMGPKFDSYGNKVADTVEEGLSVFDLLNETFGNVMISIQPLFEILPQVFDPLKIIGDSLKDMRVQSYKFLNAFETYKRGLTELAEGMDDVARDKFTRGGMLEARASFAAINNLFRSKGVFGYGPGAMSEFKKNAAKIMSEGFDPAAMLSEFAQTFMDSQIARDIGKNIGSVIRIVLKQISDFLNQLTNVAQSSQFVTGLKEGFGDEGKAAFVNIVRKVFEGLVALLLEVIKTFPLETALFAAFSLGMPALSAGISSAIGIKIERFIDRGLPELMARGDRGGRGGLGAFLSSGRMDRTRRRFLRPVRNTGRGLYQGAQLMGAFGMGAIRARGGGRDIIRQRNILGGMVRNGAKISRYVPGGAVAGGALDMGLSLASGESFGKAAAGAIGTVLGGVAGSAFGPVGTMIGMTAGGMLGDYVGNALDPSARTQREAAARQAEASAMQLQAARLRQVLPKVETPLPTTSQNLANLLSLAGVPGARSDFGGQMSGKAAQLVEEMRLRNLALQDVTRLRSELETFKGNLAANVDVNSEEYKRLVGQREAKVRAAEARLADTQGRFDRTFASLPTKARDTIVSKLSSMSTLEIERAAADLFKRTFTQNMKKYRDIRGAYYSYSSSERRSGRVPKPIEEFAKNRELVDRYSEDASPSWKGGLGDAVASELKHKPPGSNLVIANSSETVIPAAGGYGMVGFITVLRSGFGMTVMALSELRQNLTESFKLLNQTLVRNQAKTDNNFKSLETRFTSPTLPGGLGGARAGGVDAFTPIAQQFGLNMTSGYRPGDTGWHGANRARDFSNGSGPTVQMMQFAQYMASTYGANLKELIYTPLGYSIRNGQIVSPYAQRGHYNHVHVAYGLGAGSPAFFTNRRDAIKWEKSMMPGGAKVSSITTNSSEGFGTTIHAPITIYQQPGQDSEELAQIVVARLGMAVHTISNHM